MTPKYSILLCNQPLQNYQHQISQWLSLGIKVLWFGREEDVTALKQEYADFAKAFLLQAYTTSLTQLGIIVDGDGDKRLFAAIADDCPLFNAAQYKVEHCNADEHIVVQASAGTGKTTVMIDRIMYLLHTRPDLRLSEMYMITFTNDAAQQMSNRLQDAFMTRFTVNVKSFAIR